MNEWHASLKNQQKNKQCHNVYFFPGLKRKKQSRIQHHARGFLVFFFPWEKAGSQSGIPEKEHYYPPPILENAFLITDK